MSRESLLDDAILKAKEAEDWQLVEWLRMARGGESAARWYTAKLGEARLDISNLMTENAKLREMIAGAYKDMDAWQLVIASSDQWGYGKGCLERLWRLRDAMRELGIEVKLDKHE